MANTRTETCTWSASMFADNSTLPILFDRSCFSNDMLDPSGSINARSDGGDLRVFQGGVEVPREIVHFAYDSTTGAGDAAIEIWVYLTGDTASGASIEFQYGDHTLTDYAATDTYGRNAVWTGYDGVWHLNESSTPSVDATGNGSSGTWNGSPSSTTGKIGTALNLVKASSQYIDFGNVLAESGNSLTIGAWINPTALPTTYSAVILGRRRTTSPNYADYQFLLNTDGTLTFAHYNGVWENVTSTSTVSASSWQHVAATFDNTSKAAALYINGAGAGGGATFSYSLGANATPIALRSGDTFGVANVEYLNAAVDELFLDNSAFSSTRVSTEYANQNSPSTYATAGTSSAIGSGTTLTPATGSITYAGYTTDITLKITPTTGDILLTGYTPTVTQNITTALLTTTGNIIYSGYIPGIAQTVTLEITAISGAVIWSGFIPGLVQTVTTEYTPNVGSILYSGNIPVVTYPGSFVPSTLNNWLAATRENILNKLGLTPTYNNNENGYFRDIAEALENYTSISIPDNNNISGYEHTGGTSYDTIAGTDGSGYNRFEEGYLRQMAEAMENHAGASTTGSYGIRIRYASERVPL